MPVAIAFVIGFIATAILRWAAKPLLALGAIVLFLMWIQGTNVFNMPDVPIDRYAPVTKIEGLALQRSQVRVTDVQRRGGLITATVANGSTLGIQDVYLSCYYSNDDDERTSGKSDYYIYPIAAGGTATFTTNVDGANNMSKDYQCEPKFEFNNADVLRQGFAPKRNTSDILLAGSDITLTPVVTRKSSFDPWNLVVKGSITNNTKATVGSLDVRCYYSVGSFKRIGGEIPVYVEPGDTQAFQFKIGKLPPSNGYNEVSCYAVSVISN